MKKYLFGLSMAWGNFFYIPCPIRKWDDNARNYMLSWLPTIGALIGGLWLVCDFILAKINIPIMISCFIMTFLPFLLSGFIHVDGFMDVSDALGSWGTKEKKQAILKDSHVGSSAVIKIVFYILAYFCAITALIPRGVIAIYLVIIPIVPRAISTIFVLLSKKIGEEEDAKIKSEYVGVKKEGLVFLIIQLVIYIALVYIFSSFILLNTILILSLILGTSLPIIYAKKNLFGMNGDIAGFGILNGELFGLLSLVIFGGLV